MSLAAFLQVVDRGKVTESVFERTVLIFDDDLGFVWWLGEMFREAGYYAIPALSAHQAVSFMNELDLSITVVVLNPGLPGIRKSFRAFDQRRTPVKILVISDPTDPRPVIDGADGILERVSNWQTPSCHECASKATADINASRVPKSPKGGGLGPHKHRKLSKRKKKPWHGGPRY
jgi:hypothetical protein